MNISLLGTGIMGTPIAERILSSGEPLIVYNRTVEKAKPLMEQGAKWAASPKLAVEASDVAILMLADSGAIKNLLFGTSRIKFRNRTVIQMGTIAPVESRAVAAKITEAGGEYCECPVLGSREEAQNGTLIRSEERSVGEEGRSRWS